MNQVVTIGADGAISGLQRKKDQGIDLRQFGHAQIERVSEIVWKESYQKWAIKFLRTPAAFRGLVTSQIFEAVGLSIPDAAVPAEVGRGSHTMLLFDDYDDAVAAEVTFLDHLRKAGTF